MTQPVTQSVPTIAHRLASVTARIVAQYGQPVQPPVTPPVTPPQQPPVDPTGLDALTFAIDGSGIGGSVGTPFIFDVAKLHADDAAFRATIVATPQVQGNPLVTLEDATKRGTGTTTSAIYTDGRYPDLISLVPGAGPGGDAVYRATVRGLNLGDSAPTGELWVGAGNCRALWIWVRRRFQPGFSAKGDGNSAAAIAYNDPSGGRGGAGAGFKIGPYANYGYADPLHGDVTYYGRAGLQTGNGAADGAADYDLVNLPQGTPQPQGINDTQVSGVASEWKDGAWRDVVVYLGNTLDSDGVIRVHAAAWMRTVGGGAPYVPISPHLIGVIGTATQWTRPAFASVTPFSLNYNQSRATDQYYEVWGWAAFDAEKYNPFALLQDEIPQQPASAGSGLSGLAIVSDDFTGYADTAALLAAITSNGGGTG